MVVRVAVFGATGGASKARVLAIFEEWCGFRRVGKAPSPLAPLCKGELLLQCEALPTIEGLLTEVSEKRKGCGRKAIPPVVARILSGDSTSPLTRDGHGCPKLNAQSFKQGCLKSATLIRCRTQRH